MKQETILKFLDGASIGCTITVKTIESIESDSCQFISDSQDVQPITESINDKDLKDFDSYFVIYFDGYRQIWGMSGIVPYLYKDLTLCHIEEL